jgi:hypothetical protein
VRIGRWSERKARLDESQDFVTYCYYIHKETGSIGCIHWHNVQTGADALSQTWAALSIAELALKHRPFGAMRTILIRTLGGEPLDESKNDAKM